MPKIPVAVSRIPLTRTEPTVTQPLISPGPARRAGEALAETGRALEQIGQAFTRVRNLEQFTRAKTEVAKTTLDIQNIAANIPINTNDDYDKVTKDSEEKLQEMKNKALELISDQETKIKMEGAVELSSLSALNSIKIGARRRLVGALEVNRQQNVDALTQTYINERDPIKKQKALSDIKESFLNHAAMGVLSKKDATDKLAKTLDALPSMDAENAINTDPLRAEQMLINNKFGVKDPDESLRLKKLARATFERNKKDAKHTFDKKKDRVEWDAAKAVVKNEITSIAQIDKLEFASEEFKDSIKKLVLNDNIDTVDLGLEYTKLLNEFKTLDLDKDGDIEAGLEKLARYKISLIKAKDKKVISKSTYLNNLELINDPYNEATREVVKTRFRQGKEIRGFWKTLLKVSPLFISPITAPVAIGKLIKGAIGKRLPEDEQNEAMMFMDKELTKRMLEKEIPEDKVNEVAMDIFKKYLKTIHPEIVGLDDVPNSIYDAERGFNNVNNSSFKGEAEWEYRDGKLIRKQK